MVRVTPPSSFSVPRPQVAHRGVNALVFEAQVQRDRMLVNAYRNVLSRVTASTL